MKINLSVPAADLATSYRNPILLYFNALQDLGHSVIITHNQVLTGYFNIFAFHTIFDDAYFTALRASGVRFGFISFESYSGDGFAHGKFRSEDEEERYKAFVSECRIVFCHYQDDVEAYAPLTDKAVLLPYGFHPKMEEIVLAKDKLLDIYFYGSVHNEPHRAALLKKLVDTGFGVGFHEIGSHDVVRNSYIAAAKINLNLVHRPGMRHISYRIPYLANNRICPISTAALDREGYLKFARVFSDANLVEGCRDFIVNNRWEKAGEQMYEKFRAYPMTACMAAALDKCPP